MRTVWKAPLLNGVTQEDGHLLVTMGAPEDATFIHAALQFNVPNVWFFCTPDKPDKKHQLAVVPTGGKVPDGAEYVGTFAQDEGTFIWHVFAL